MEVNLNAPNASIHSKPWHYNLELEVAETNHYLHVWY